MKGRVFGGRKQRIVGHRRGANMLARVPSERVIDTNDQPLVFGQEPKNQSQKPHRYPLDVPGRGAEEAMKARMVLLSDGTRSVQDARDGVPSEAEDPSRPHVLQLLDARPLDAPPQ